MLYGEASQCTANFVSSFVFQDRTQPDSRSDCELEAEKERKDEIDRCKSADFKLQAEEEHKD